MVLLNKDEIKELIPHREPFLLIDEIVALDPGKKCTAIKRTSLDDFWFQGHFPDYPVTPGVLMIEMLAQAGGVCIASVPEHRGKLGLFAKISNAKFRRQVVPGDMLELSVEVTKIKSSVAVCKATAMVDGEKAVTADLTFAFAPQRPEQMDNSVHQMDSGDQQVDNSNQPMDNSVQAEPEPAPDAVAVGAPEGEIQ